ncbi:hypothetical protein [Shimia ponticola]|uniref:hypothetical protein n=1 Tax=Shimia ponticola TaxID=2582893 RepID=UPI0011BD938E|nr:hypothetical protein [Shimia ponticola]
MTDAPFVPGYDLLYRPIDIINGRYATVEGAPAPVVEYKKVIEKGAFHTQQFGGTDYQTYNFVDVNSAGGGVGVTKTGSSASDFSKQLTETVNIEGTYNLFSGELSAQFGETQERSASFVYAMTRGGLFLNALAHIGDAAGLKPYLDHKYVSALTGDMDPEAFIDAYFGHFLTHGIFGGTLTFSAQTFKSSTDTTMSISTTISAAYGELVKGSSSTDFSTETKTMIENSQMRVSVQGGGTAAPIFGGGTDGADFTTFNAAGVAAWKQAVTNEPDLVQYGENALTAHWDLCEDPDRAQQLKDAWHAKAEAGQVKDTAGSFRFARQFGAWKYQQSGNEDRTVITLNENFPSDTNNQWSPVDLSWWTNGALKNQSNIAFYAACDPGSDPDLVPVFLFGYGPSLTTTDKEGLMPYAFSLDPVGNNQPGWVPVFNAATASPPVTRINNWDHIAFYAYKEQKPGTVPVYQFVANQDWTLYALSTDEYLPTYSGKSFATGGADEGKNILFYTYPYNG